MELMAYAGLVGGTTDKICLFPDRATAIFVVDWCQIGPSWIFGLKMELMVCKDLVRGTTEKSCLFPDLI